MKNEEWKEYKLGDVAFITKLAGFEFTKYIQYNNSGEIIALRALNIRNGFLDLGDVKHISQSVSDLLPRSKLFKGDIIFTYTGNGYGDCTIIDQNDKYHLAPNICKISVNQNIADPYFVFSVIRSSFFQKQVSNYVGGSSQPTIPMETIRKLTIRLPSLATQKEITKILSALDDKIELNNAINRNLEEQAQAIFKSWFVDFEPFGGKRPSDWEKTNIYNIANIIYGAPFSSKLFNTEKNGKPIYRIRDLKDQHSDVYTPENIEDAYLIQPKDIVVGMDGEFRPYLWGGEPGWLNQRVCVFENKRPKGKAFLYFTIKPLLDKVEKTQVATTVIHIGKKDFDKFEILLPSNDVLDKFDELTNPIIDQIVSKRLENKRLANLRNDLLPKLMSNLQ
ncbi:MAG: restriction endonuclease subunit S [Treponema sp.]|nr:restriction endonuclease subunit S [Treponema sp.]